MEDTATKLDETKGKRPGTKKTLLTISRVCSIITQVLFILSIVGEVLALIGFVTSLSVDWSWISHMITTNYPGSEFDPAVLTTFNMVGYTLTGVLSCAAGGTILFFVYRFFKSIVTEQTPFNDKAVHNLLLIGIFSLVSEILVWAIMAIYVAATHITVDLGGFSGPSFFSCLFIFALALVFKYGTELQKEADTTL
jgi:hypothetical protein